MLLHEKQLFFYPLLSGTPSELRAEDSTKAVVSPLVQVSWFFPPRVFIHELIDDIILIDTFWRQTRAYHGAIWKRTTFEWPLQTQTLITKMCLLCSSPRWPKNCMCRSEGSACKMVRFYCDRTRTLLTLSTSPYISTVPPKLCNMHQMNGCP